MEKVDPKKHLSKSSFYGFRKAFIKNEKLPLEARFLIILLFTYMGKNKNCWPSQGELAKRMGRDADTVRKYLKVLGREGHLKIESRGIGRSLFYTPSYLKISAGSSPDKQDYHEPAEIVRQEPAETPTDRSIVSGNKDKEFLKGKELFEKRRRELGLISNKTRIEDSV